MAGPDLTALLDDLFRDATGRSSDEFLLADREGVGRWGVEQRWPVGQVDPRVSLHPVASDGQAFVQHSIALTVVLQQGDLTTNAQVIRPGTATEPVGLIT